jgi:hypothetical protein
MKEALRSPLAKQILLVISPLVYYPMAWGLFSFVRFKTIWDALSYFGPILYCIGLLHILSFIFLNNYLKRIGFYEDIVYIGRVAVGQTRPYLSPSFLNQRIQLFLVKYRMWRTNLVTTIRIISLRRSGKLLR